MEKSAEGITLSASDRGIPPSGTARERLLVGQAARAELLHRLLPTSPAAPEDLRAAQGAAQLREALTEHRRASAPRQPRLRRELLPGTSAGCWTRAQTGEQGRGERRRTVPVRHSWKLMQHVSDLLVPMLSSLSPSLCSCHSLLAGRGQSEFPRKLLETQQHPCPSTTTHTHFHSAHRTSSGRAAKPLPPTDSKG